MDEYSDMVDDFDEVLDCPFCKAKGGGSSAIPVPTKWHTAVHWAACDECSRCWAKSEEYWPDHLDYDGQVEALAEYTPIRRRLRKRDFVTWNDMEMKEQIIGEIRRQFRDIARQSGM
jgi:hypothetical protein